MARRLGMIEWALVVVQSISQRRLPSAAGKEKTKMAGERILIVEDDMDLADTLKTVLESAGYNVSTAVNREDAWEKVNESRPDLAILDVMLDTLAEGIQLAGEFRRDEGLKEMPIVMLTAINQRLALKIEPDGEEGYLPVDEFMEKPADPDKLLKVVARLL